MVLPATLTLWVLVQAYLWVDASIAQPINAGIRYGIAQLFAVWPDLPAWMGILPTADTMETARQALGLTTTDAAQDAAIVYEYQVGVVNAWWIDYPPVRTFGLLVAILAVYIIGRLVGGLVGRAAYRWVERAIFAVPVIKKIYSWIKQIVDFLFSQQKKSLKFSRVVAVEYPRKGIWSVGFQTGDAMRSLTGRTGDNSVTVFIPSSPTPFTGYTVTVSRKDTIDLPLTVEEAIGFAISGGVLRPPSQVTGGSTERLTTATASPQDEEDNVKEDT